MTTSQRIAVASVIVAAALTALVYWIWPNAPWWALVIIFVLVTGMVCDLAMRIVAYRRVVDRDW